MFSRATLGVLLSGLACVGAHAAIPLYTVSPGFSGFGTFGNTGQAVTVTQNITLTQGYNLTALGLLDSGFRANNYQYYQPPGSPPSNTQQIFSQGFFGSHTVTLLDSSSGVVAQTTFAAGLTGYVGPGQLPLSNEVSTLNVGQFRYIDITPVALSAGQYSLQSTWTGGDRDGMVIKLVNDGYSTAPGATLGNVSLSVTSTTFGVGFTGNLLLDPVAVSPVPEPSEMAMMLVGLGAVGAMARRRKRMSTAPAL